MHYVLTFGTARTPKYFENKSDLLAFISDVESLLSNKMRTRIKVWRCPYGYTQFRNIWRDYMYYTISKDFYISTLKDFM